MTRGDTPTASLSLRWDRATGRLRVRRFWLSVRSGRLFATRMPIEARPLVVGTDDACDVRLVDPAVSRQHLEVSAERGGVRIRDLDSKNGTFIAGMKIQQVLIGDDVSVRVGKTDVRIECEDEDRGTPKPQARFAGRTARSSAMQRVYGLLAQVAPHDSTVLLHGETGTGKEVLARAIHEASPRRERPFEVLDCTALNPGLAESELFGHVRGAFTDAVSTRAGAFERAQGGTLFLDEVAELPLELQPKLLRVLERGTLRRLGDDAEFHADVRIVAATHKDLEAEVRAGKFRQDLFFRLAVLVVEVPPLRARRDDLPLLTEELLKDRGASEKLDAEALSQLERHDFPGNVRELRNVVDRYLAGQRPFIEPSMRPSAMPLLSGLAELPLQAAKEQVLEGFTREYLQRLHERHGGNISRMSRASGTARHYLRKLLKRLGIER